MANTFLIQLKRSSNTAIPPTLESGEPAYTSNGDILYIGANGEVVPIAGKRTPGTLTANQALVADANGYINQVKVSNNLVIGNSTVNISINSTSISGGSIVANTANTANYLETANLSTIQGYITSNAATAYTNAVAYVDGKSYVNTSQLSSNLANYVNTSGSYTFTGVHTHNANIVIATAVGVSANGTFGSNGQVLTSNGTTIYWSTVAGVNTAAQYSWSNTHTFNANITFGDTTNLIFQPGADIYANGVQGTAGQVLTSNGSAVYWSTPSSGGGATLTANNTDSQTYYLPMSNASSGSWTNAVVSTTKLYFVPSTGTLNATVFNSLSDENFKTNIQTITDSINKIKEVRGVEFNWLDNGEKSSGIIAQELEKVLPHLVRENSGIKTVNYDGIIGYLIECIKELNERITLLENK